MPRIRDRNFKGMLIAFMVALISAFNFYSFEGTENFKRIHIVTLLLCGMGIGVFMIKFIDWMKSRRRINQE